MTTPQALITCTFPDGTSHAVECPPDAQLAVLAIRHALGSLTSHEADAIQLFSTEGDGRELTNEQEVVPPGAQLHALIRDLQTERKAALRTALANKDHAGCWARMVPCPAKSPYPLIAERGDVVRLTAVNGPYYSFIGLCRRLHDGDSEMKDTPDYYLLHESEFSILWTRNRGNLNGEDMEADWFMYYEEGDEVMEDPEPVRRPAYCQACDGQFPPGQGHVFWYRNAIELDGRRFYSACRACIERHDIDEPAMYTD